MIARRVVLSVFTLMAVLVSLVTLWALLVAENARAQSCTTTYVLMCAGDYYYDYDLEEFVYSGSYNWVPEQLCGGGGQSNGGRCTGPYSYFYPNYCCANDECPDQLRCGGYDGYYCETTTAVNNGVRVAAIVSAIVN